MNLTKNSITDSGRGQDSEKQEKGKELLDLYFVAYILCFIYHYFYNRDFSLRSI